MLSGLHHRSLRGRGIGLGLALVRQRNGTGTLGRTSRRRGWRRRWGRGVDIRSARLHLFDVVRPAANCGVHRTRIRPEGNPGCCPRHLPGRRRRRMSTQRSAFRSGKGSRSTRLIPQIAEAAPTGNATRRTRSLGGRGGGTWKRRRGSPRIAHIAHRFQPPRALGGGDNALEREGEGIDIIFVLALSGYNPAKEELGDAMERGGDSFQEEGFSRGRGGDTRGTHAHFPLLLLHPLVALRCRGSGRDRGSRLGRVRRRTSLLTTGRSADVELVFIAEADGRGSRGSWSVRTGRRDRWSVPLAGGLGGYVGTGTNRRVPTGMCRDCP